MASTSRVRREHPELTEVSRWVDLDGAVHYLDYGGPAAGPELVLVHGLGGSAVNWAALAPSLAHHGRVVAPDLAGFGRTQSSGRSTNVAHNAKLLRRFVEEVLGGGPVVLVGNSMGGLISLMLTDRHPELVSGLVLVDPAMPVGIRARPHPAVVAMFAAMAVPAAGRTLVERRRSQQSAEEAAMEVLRLCTVDVSRVPQHVVAMHAELVHERLEYPDVDAELIRAARSLLWVIGRNREYYRMLHRITVPVLLLHGDKDRLVPIAAAERAARTFPEWRFEVAHDIGHVPQLEAPEWTLGKMLDWLADVGLASRRGRR
jgi:pimeloyl-ACP methyl ester carboxylesterase